MIPCTDTHLSRRPGFPRTPRAVGRPLDTGLTDRLLTTTLALVAAHGLLRFNADVLAAAAGAGKAGVYRRWRDTDALVAAALRTHRPIPAVPDRGSLRDDLVAVLQPLTTPLSSGDRALAAVLGQAHHDAGLRAALRAVVEEPLDAALSVALARHARRGLPAPGPRVAVLRRLVLALWWARFAPTSEPSTEQEIRDVVDLVLLPILLDGVRAARDHG